MGPLEGVKIIEVGGIGPGPFCGMMLSDMGADIVRIERKGGLSLSEPKYDILTRNRRSVFIDLRKPQGVATALKIIERWRWQPHSLLFEIFVRRYQPSSDDRSDCHLCMIPTIPKTIYAPIHRTTRIYKPPSPPHTQRMWFPAWW